MVVSFEVARIFMYICVCLGTSPLADLTNMRLVRPLPAEKGPPGELGLVCFVFGVAHVFPLVFGAGRGVVTYKKPRL